MSSRSTTIQYQFRKQWSGRPPAAEDVSLLAPADDTHHGVSNARETHVGTRRARPRGAHLGRAAGLAHRPRRHRREVHPWRRPAQPGRQAPARRRCGAPLRNRPRTRGGTGQEQRDPGRSHPAHRARPRRARRDPRRVAHLPPDRPVRGRALRRALRDERGQGQLLQPARRTRRARLGACPGARHRASRRGTSNKGHERIENRLHHVRDVSYDEDRCRVRTGHLPRNLACLTNLAISIVRLKGRFDSIPQAHRHYARRPQDAVRQLINPPTC